DTTLWQQADQLAQLQAEHDRLSNRLPPTNRSFADDRSSELLRLRSEAAMLRQQTNDLTALQEANRRMREQNSQQSNQVKTPLQLKEEGVVRARVAKNFMLAFRLYAMDNHDHFPAGFDQVTRYLPEALDADPVLSDLAEFVQMTNRFEILYSGPLDAITNEGNVIVLREKQARQWADGSWSKVYGFADGHSETRGSTDGNFDDWEKQHIITPANP